jgi:hypothetical protein
MRIRNNETADRVSRKLSALLAGIEHEGKFGHLTLFSGLIIDPGRSCPASELKQARWLEVFHALKDSHGFWALLIFGTILPAERWF